MKFRYYFKGKCIGCPYKEYSLKRYIVLILEDCIQVISRKQCSVFVTIDLDFVEKVEFVK